MREEWIQNHPVGLQSHLLSLSPMCIGKGFPPTLEGSSCKGSSISVAPGPFPPHLFLLPWGDGVMSFQLVNLGRIMGILPPSWEGSGPEEYLRARLCYTSCWGPLPPAQKSALLSTAITYNPGFPLAHEATFPNSTSVSRNVNSLISIYLFNLKFIFKTKPRGLFLTGDPLETPHCDGY